MAKAFTVRELLRDQGATLGLRSVGGAKIPDKLILVSEVNRPGLALGGYLEHFRAERVQIIGRGEHDYCIQAEPRRLMANLGRMFSFPEVPCLIVTRGQRPAAALVSACRKARVPLLISSLDTASFVGELAVFLEDRLAPSTTVHGVLVDIYGLGVLIQGDSGIGKSECALELLKRGHILVSDDVVEIRHKRGNVLTGSCPEPLRHYMEVRGLGIIDVKLLFGIGSILNQSRVELAVYLDAWEKAPDVDRTGLENQTTKILGVELPMLKIPVSPGRNLAVLIEVAALNQRLRGQGYFAARKLNEDLLRRMRPPRKGRISA